MPGTDDKAAAEKAAADKAAAEKAAADKAAADAAAKAAAAGTSGGDGAGHVDFAGDGKDETVGKTGSAATGGATGADLKLAIPDDMKQHVPEDVAALYVKVAKEEGVSQKALDRLAGLNFERTRMAVQTAEREMADATQEVVREWRRELAADPVLGGSPEKAQQAKAVFERGARALGGESLLLAVRAHLRGEDPISGPMLVRALHMAGLAETEDHLGEGDTTTGTGKDANLTPQQRQMKRRYPSHQKPAGAQK